MLEEERLPGTRREISHHWPLYLVGYGGGFLALFAVIAVGTARDWWGLVSIAGGLILVSAYFLFARLWAAYQLFDRRDQQPAHLLATLAQLRPNSRFVHLGLGRRLTAIQLSRRLTSGHVTVVDLYNPQLTPSSPLARSRRGTHHFPPDPRLTWLDGAIDLLPLPDGGAEVVTTNRLLGEFWQHGDRRLLLREIRRVLAPGGRLVLVEQSRSLTNLLVTGPAAWRLLPLSYWRTLFESAGFRLNDEGSIQGLVHYFVLEKPLAGEPQQLRFDFGL